MYNETASSESSESFTVGVEAGVEGGEETSGSGKVSASYTSGTSYTSEESTTVSSMDLEGSQGPKDSIYYTGLEDEDFLAGCSLNSNEDSTDANCLIRTTAKISARGLSAGSLEKAGDTIVGTGYYINYPKFSITTTDPLPDDLHTTDITYSSSFILIKPKSSVEAQEGTETLYIDWDLSYQYLTWDSGSLTDGCLMESPVVETFAWKDDNTIPIAFRYNTFPAVSEEQTTNLPMKDFSTIAENEEILETDIVDYFSDFGETESNAGCSQASSIMNVFDLSSAVSSWIARGLSGDSAQDQAENQYVLPTVDSEVECRTICYATGLCYWAKWGPVDQTETDSSSSHAQNRCFTSTDNCAKLSYNPDSISCEDNTSNYYFSKYSNNLDDSQSNVTPYYISRTTYDESETPTETIISGGCIE